MKKLEPENYYSLGDLAKLFNTSESKMESVLEEKNIKPYHMLNRKIYIGKMINEKIIGKKQNLKFHRKFIPITSNNHSKTLTRVELLEKLELDSHTFNHLFIKQYDLKMCDILKNGAHIYHIDDVNDVIKRINDDRTFSFYPALLNEDTTYYTNQICQNLKISHSTFKRIYIKMFGLSPCKTEAANGYQNRAFYRGHDINKISLQLRSM